MASLNKVQIIGNLGADPKISQTQNGVLIANFNVGCTDRFKDSQGVQQSKTEWVRVVLFNGTADVAQKYLHKGSLVYIEGKLQTRSYKDNQGIDRYVTEVIGSTMQMLGGKPEQAQNQPAPAPQTTYAQAPHTNYAQPVQPAPVAPQQPATAPQQSPYVLPPQQEQQGNFGETDPLDDIPF